LADCIPSIPRVDLLNCCEAPDDVLCNDSLMKEYSVKLMIRRDRCPGGAAQKRGDDDATLFARPARQSDAHV